MEQSIPIAFFFFMFWVIVGVARVISDNRVRSKALDNSATPEVIAAIMTPAARDLGGALKWGIITTLLAIAFIVVGQFRLDEYSEPLALGVILLGPGLGLLIYYAIAKRQISP